MMITARFNVFPDLNHFLPPERRGGLYEERFEYGQTVKHLIEAAGAPHTEIGQIRANGNPVGLDYQVQGGDLIEVFQATALNAPLTIPALFVLDSHLGRLAAYLRMLGFDAAYRNDFDDDELASISAVQDRILLTRDRHLLMRKTVRYGYCLRSLDPAEQLAEVLRRYDLLGRVTPFQRCLRCNTPLQPVEKSVILERLQPLTRQYFEEFHICPNCGQIYWKGSHYEHMQSMIGRLQDGAGTHPAS